MIEFSYSVTPGNPGIPGNPSQCINSHAIKNNGLKFTDPQTGESTFFGPDEIQRVTTTVKVTAFNIPKLDTRFYMKTHPQVVKMIENLDPLVAAGTGKKVLKRPFLVEIEDADVVSRPIHHTTIGIDDVTPTPGRPRKKRHTHRPIPGVRVPGCPRCEEQ